ncbi:uncharacterized protein SPSC_02751 [Sporisorium scitamineum]|uniref:Uncharacterized protein n=1 Tax=Sporisorium scitamineum TaxID=49012 RepID=A0A127ZDS2_9BASI|nr:uncharacterized protein SPSC_02751 [Sporisorium scitamineum]
MSAANSAADIVLASSVAAPPKVPIWEAYAARLSLEKKDDPAFSRPNPLLPFHELPPYLIKARDVTARLDPGTVRLVVPPRVKLQSDSSKLAAALDICQQLLKHYDRKASGSIIFSKHHKQTIMDIVWFSLTPFDPNTALELNGEFVIFLAAASPVNPTWITILVQDVGDNMFEQARKTLSDFLFPHQILDFWRTATERPIEGSSEPDLLNTGELILLVELDTSVRLNENFRTSVQALHPYDAAHQIPGLSPLVNRSTSSYLQLAATTATSASKRISPTTSTLTRNVSTASAAAVVMLVTLAAPVQWLKPRRP